MISEIFCEEKDKFSVPVMETFLCAVITIPYYNYYRDS